jgi:prevent-host-death family protein
MEWQMADAKNRFSEMLNLAASQGPQRVRRQKDAFMVVTEEEWERLSSNRPDFKEYLMTGPSFDGVDLTRDPSPMRDVEP